MRVSRSTYSEQSKVVYWGMLTRQDPSFLRVGQNEHGPWANSRSSRLLSRVLLQGEETETIIQLIIQYSYFINSMTWPPSPGRKRSDKLMVTKFLIEPPSLHQFILGPFPKYCINTSTAAPHRRHDLNPFESANPRPSCIWSQLPQSLQLQMN